MDVPTYSETIFITDAAINIFPDLDVKRDIIQNAIDLWTDVGLGTPRVAILSAVETVTSKIPSTIEAAALCKMADRGQITGGILDGPLAFDNAIDPEAARIKGIEFPVAGRAQISSSRIWSPAICSRRTSFSFEGGCRRHCIGRARPDYSDVARRFRSQPYGVVRCCGAPGRRTPPDNFAFEGLVCHGRDPRRQCRFFKRQVPGVRNRQRERIAAPAKRADRRHRHKAAVRREANDGSSLDQVYPTEKRSGRAGRTCDDCRLASRDARFDLAAVGHRVVHGGPDYDYQSSSIRSCCKVGTLCLIAPLHQPNNLAPIRTLFASRPNLLQVACFDTAFHRGHSAVADRYAIPERFYAEGVRRYGFHGLSYEFVAERLRDIAPKVATGRVVVAHLGSGASMCGLADGRSVESTMGFTALDGIPMGTRPGSSIPASFYIFCTEKGMAAGEVQDMLYRESGLMGLSGYEQRHAGSRSNADPRAAFAVNYFVYRVALNAGMLAAAMERD